MNDSIKRISLDIHSASSGETVKAKRGDTARKIYISLIDGGLPYIIGKDCYAVFTGKKPDRKVVYNDCTIKDNTIIYQFTEQTVAVAGRMNCEIKLYGADGKLITSPKFTILVFDTVYDEGDEVESSDEFNALTSLIADTKEAIKDAQDALEIAQQIGSSSRITEITLLASAWKTEAEGSYSQVATIAGVTPYSKVDLLPSVEQLAIFHNKDVAFVTENEDGVVTVFAIGDKPVLDYTMQASITEVVV